MEIITAKRSADRVRWCEHYEHFHQFSCKFGYEVDRLCYPL